MKYTVIIVDDEAHAIRTLTAQLSWTKLPLEVIGTANSVEEAEKLLVASKPDFLFMDIKMPAKTGFELFPIIDESVTEAIFVTAHDQFALKAYQYHASGYLMKPVSTLELKSLLQKLIERRGKLAGNNQDLVLAEKSGMVRLPLKSIVYISAESGYTVLHFDSGTKRTVPKLLKELEENLEAKGFVRCHNKYLVNMEHVIELKKARNSELKLSSGFIVPVSRSKKSEVYRSFDSIR